MWWAGIGSGVAVAGLNLLAEQGCFDLLDLDLALAPAFLAGEGYCLKWQLDVQDGGYF